VEAYDLRNDPWELSSRPGRVPDDVVQRALGRCVAMRMPNWKL
jgi:hypothetical protein